MQLRKAGNVRGDPPQKIALLLVVKCRPSVLKQIDIIQNKQVIFSNIYVYTERHVIAISEKEGGEVYGRV